MNNKFKQNTAGPLSVLTLIILLSSQSAYTMPLTSEQEQRMRREVGQELAVNVENLFKHSASSLRKQTPPPVSFGDRKLELSSARGR